VILFTSLVDEGPASDHRSDGCCTINVNLTSKQIKLRLLPEAAALHSRQDLRRIAATARDHLRRALQKYIEDPLSEGLDSGLSAPAG